MGKYRMIQYWLLNESPQSEKRVTARPESIEEARTWVTKAWWKIYLVLCEL